MDNTFINTKLCTLCNKVNKFKVIYSKTGPKLSGRKCIACTSAKNNLKLKEKDYYKTYYINNAEKIKENDKIRYRLKKEQNIVKFTFDQGTVVGEV